LRRRPAIRLPSTEEFGSRLRRRSVESESPDQGVCPCAVATTAVGAQDKPKAAATAKANAGVASKPAKATAQAPLKADATAQKALGEREGSKAYKPAAIGDTPDSGRGYKRGGCDSEGSDA
jgi:hypothetical protein